MPKGFKKNGGHRGPNTFGVLEVDLYFFYEYNTLIVQVHMLLKREHL